MRASDVFEGRRAWSVETAKCEDWLKSLPDNSIDLLFCSPPYENRRSYGMGFRLVGEDWVSWMFEIVRLAMPKVRGLMAIVCEGKTDDYRWSATPALLQADLHRAGFNLRKTVAFHRSGISGGGGPDWLRNDWEHVICITNPGRLPWSDNVACGAEPKYGPGGQMSHRVEDGTRVNMKRVRQMKAEGMSQRAAARLVGLPLKAGTSTSNGDDLIHGKTYIPPEKANPANVLWFPVGGGRMGNTLCHQNEAPFPVGLAEFFVKSFCPPGGVTADIFCGSSTTGDAALRNGRRYISCDARESQRILSIRRLRDVEDQLAAKT